MIKLDSRNKITSYKEKVLDILICICIVLILYIPTLSRPWLFFDENIIYKETFAPIPLSFSEIFETIKSFGLSSNFVSSNYTYSNIYLNRTNFLGIPFFLTFGFFLQKNAFLYHLLNLLFHIINTALVYLILNKVQNSKFVFRAVLILLTILWAIHPAHIESILLSTNSATTLSYTFFFLLFYDFLKNSDKNNLLIRKTLLPIIFFTATLLHEYVIFLLPILITYKLIIQLKKESIIKSIKETSTVCFPYLLGFGFYITYFLCRNLFLTPFSTSQNLSIPILLERVFWLAPQIFVHNIKLIFFPKILSLDQTTLIHFGKSLSDKYSIFCFIFMIAWLLVPAFIFLTSKRFHRLIILSILFFISLLPFTQMLFSSYCLTSERYLYIPIFFIIFGASLYTNDIYNKKITGKFLVICILLVCNFLFFGRAYLRANDWKNSYTLIRSTIKSSYNSLYKGSRYNTLAETFLNEEISNHGKSTKYFNLAQKHFRIALKEFKGKKNDFPNQPRILEYYGLDYGSLITKSAYVICVSDFTKPNSDFKASLNFFLRHFKLTKDTDPRALELYANLLIKNYEIVKAKEIFELAHKKYPGSPFILLSLIKFKKDFENNLIEAKHYLNKALTIFPYTNEFLLEALQISQAENNLEDYAKYAYLLGFRTHSIFFLHEALVAYLTLSKTDEAKNAIDRLLVLDKKNPKTLYFTGSYFIRKNDYQKAIEYLKEANAALDEREDEALSFNIKNALANLNIVTGNLNTAVFYTEEALKLANSNPQRIEKVKQLFEKLNVNKH